MTENPPYENMFLGESFSYGNSFHENFVAEEFFAGELFSVEIWQVKITPRTIKNMILIFEDEIVILRYSP